MSAPALDFIEVWYEDAAIALVTRYENGTLFEYEPEFMARGTELSPFQLPVARGRFFRNNPDFNLLPGMLSDALPDYYGTTLMERYFRQHNWPAPGPLEKLAYVGGHGIGALSFRPAIGREEEVLKKINLAAAAAEQPGPDYRDPVMTETKRVTGTAGGAQPKALVTLNTVTGEFYPGAALMQGCEPLLVKFQTEPGDETPLLEHALAQTAKRCGIDAVDSRLIPSAPGKQGPGLWHFAARRFDIQGRRRLHYLSFAGATEGHYGPGTVSPDYTHLLTAAGRLARDIGARKELLRRAIFNVAVANIDDHIRNHGFLFDGKEWQLAPAFDLTHSAISERTERAMPVAGVVRNVTHGDFERLAAQSGMPWPSRWNRWETA